MKKEKEYRVVEEIEVNGVKSYFIERKEKFLFMNYWHRCRMGTTYESGPEMEFPTKERAIQRIEYMKNPPKVEARVVEIQLANWST